MAPVWASFDIALGNHGMSPLCCVGIPGKGRFPQLRSGVSLLWSSGQPFGVPDVGNEITHAHPVTEGPSGTQELCTIEAHRRELTFVMAFHQQSCSEPEKKDFGMITIIFHSLPFCLFLSKHTHAHMHTHMALTFLKHRGQVEKK